VTSGATQGDTRLEILEGLLAISFTDLKQALSGAVDLVARVFSAHKVDAFMYDPERDCLAALGTSNQPLSALQRKHGLDVLPLANGGRSVLVFRTGEPFLSGHADEDPEEVRGIREVLRVRSTISVPLEVGGERRGVLTVASQDVDVWNEEDLRFAGAVARWVAILGHRAELLEAVQKSAVVLGRRAAAEELMTVLAHDLRAYLGPADMRLQLIIQRAKRDGRDEDAHDAALARRGLHHVTTQISDVLDVSRLDRGVLTVDLQPVEVSPLVRDLVTTLATADHPVSLNIGEDLVVLGDPARLRQCLQNIVANALTYSPRGAAVLVKVARAMRRSLPCAKIEVVDRGPGIAADVLPHLFERFVSGGKKRGGGLGIGLYLAKQIAELHRGSLEASTSPGGAVFELLIPLHDRADESA
jgi:signal transduction histidine kinase